MFYSVSSPLMPTRKQHYMAYRISDPHVEAGKRPTERSAVPQTACGWRRDGARYRRGHAGVRYIILGSSDVNRQSPAMLTCVGRRFVRLKPDKDNGSAHGAFDQSHDQLPLPLTNGRAWWRWETLVEAGVKMLGKRMPVWMTGCLFGILWVVLRLARRDAKGAPAGCRPRRCEYIECWISVRTHRGTVMLCRAQSGRLWSGRPIIQVAPQIAARFTSRGFVLPLRRSPARRMGWILLVTAVLGCSFSFRAVLYSIFALAV